MNLLNLLILLILLILPGGCSAPKPPAATVASETISSGTVPATLSFSFPLRFAGEARTPLGLLPLQGAFVPDAEAGGTFARFAVITPHGLTLGYGRLQAGREPEIFFARNAEARALVARIGRALLDLSRGPETTFTSDDLTLTVDPAHEKKLPVEKD